MAADLPRPHWYIQVERIRGEGTWTYLDGMTARERLASAAVETCFHGKGGRQKVIRAARALAVILDADVSSPVETSPPQGEPT